MADLITAPMGQMMAGQDQPADPAQAAPQPNNLAQQATQQQQNAPASPDQSSGSDSNPKPVGTQQDAQNAQNASNGNSPMNRVPATPQEQAEYNQLVSRYVLMISDMRPSPGHGKSPLDSCLQQMNNPKQTVAMAVGYTTAQEMFILHNGAKQQKFQYSPDVMFHAADECIVATYLLGQARGIFKGTPPYQGLKEDATSYPFTKEEINIIGHAKLFATQKFGALMQSHGQISTTERQQAMDFWHQQIVREIKSGEVDPSIIKKMSQIKGIAQAANNPSAPQVVPEPPPAPPPAPPAPPPPAPLPAGQSASAPQQPPAGGQ